MLKDEDARTLEPPLISSAENDKVAGTRLRLPTETAIKSGQNIHNSCLKSLNINQSGLISFTALMGSHTFYHTQ